MFEVFRNAWKLADLRKKILYTLFIIFIFRLGASIFVPFLDTNQIASVLGINSSSGSLFSYWDQMTGGSLSNGTLFAMSITPYINASIIIQLLTVAIRPLERLAKEGDEGRKKLNKINKLVALGLAIFQAVAFYITLRNGGVVKYTSGFEGVLAAIVIVGCFVAGASLIIWLGDQISEKGIGNGISMILFAGIVSRIPGDVIGLFNTISAGDMKNAILVPIILIIYIGMITLVVLMTNAERKIPVQYAKRVVGRKMYGGQSSYIPIKVAMSGVMPIIFAMSIMSLPSTICFFFGINGDGTSGHDFWEGFVRLFSTSSWLYAVLYFLLIIGFNYFYVAIQYNPIQIANDLKKNNGAIPGYRPGQPTADFINNSLSKVTLIGAIFLGFIAIFPIIFQNISGIQGLSLGGTTVLIVVGVALETVRSLESQMMMRHHKGFLE